MVAKWNKWTEDNIKFDIVYRLTRSTTGEKKNHREKYVCLTVQCSDTADEPNNSLLGRSPVVKIQS